MLKLEVNTLLLHVCLLELFHLREIDMLSGEATLSKRFLPPF